MRSQSLIPVLSGVVLILIWAGISAFLNSRYFPAPHDVLSAFITDFSSGDLFHNLGKTLFRVVTAFCLSISIGVALGFALGRNERINLFFDPWLIFALNLPALVVIVFCYLWLGLNEAAAIIAVALNKIPNTAIMIREGTRALDRDLDEVATLYEFNGWKRFRIIYWPQLEPYMASALRNGLALIWKIVLIVELIGRSDGVGFQINLAFGQFDLARILVYALSFMTIIWLVEIGFIKPWERSARAWRGEQQ